jgi:hypothetical protein
MPDIRINQLPAATGPTAPTTVDNIAIDGATVRRATVQQIVDVGIPVASQAEAEAGTNPTKRMTPLTTAQAISARAATVEQGALADSALQSGDVGTAAFENIDFFATAAQGLLAASALQNRVYTFAGDATTNDTANFTALEASIQGAVIDLNQKTYLVNTLPLLNTYINGSFKFSDSATVVDQRGTIVPGDDSPGMISGVTTTGAFGTKYSGGVNNTPGVPGRTNRNRRVMVGSQGSRSDFNISGNYTSIYSWAYGNVSGNIFSRESVAGCPQAGNVCAEEGQVNGFGGVNVNNQFSQTSGTKCGNYNTRLSNAESARYAANFSTVSSRAGGGYNGRFTPVFTDDRITSVTIDSGGVGYDLDHLMFYTARQTQPTETVASTAVDTANETITVINNTKRWVTGIATTYQSTTGTPIGGLTVGTTYYVNRVGTTSIRLATSPANAVSGPFVNLTSQGTGNHVFSCDANFSFTVDGTGAITSVTVISEGRGYVSTEFGDIRVQYPSDSYGEAAGNYSTIQAYTKGKAAASIASTTVDNYGENSFVAASNSGSSTDRAYIRQAVIASSQGRAISTGSVVLSGVICDVTGDGSIVTGRRVINPAVREVAGGDSPSGAASSANRKWSINNGTGLIKSVLATSVGTFADYAEYFPNLTGTEIPVGTIVQVNGDGVEPWDGDGDIAGVVSATAAFIAGDSHFTWAGRYLYDEFGRPVMTSGVDEDTGEAIMVHAENPTYDPSIVAVPRSERPNEWTLVGLMGQVFTRVGEYTKTNDIIGGRLRVMKITTPFSAEKGYGVARCFIH